MEQAANPPSNGIDSALANALARIEIPPRPAILDQVMAEMQSDEPDFRKLSALIMSDVGLSAGLIKTANAPIFGFRTKAATVREALTMLGLVMVLRTVAAHAVREVLPETPALKGFWDTSARVAHLCGWLSRELGIQYGVRPQDAFTFGLFRDCGIPVLMKTHPGYEAIYAAARSAEDRPFTEVERAQLQLDHALVGSVMARSWYLPDPLCDALRYHHQLTAPELSVAGQRMAALAMLAEWLQGQGDAAVEAEWRKQGGDTLEVLQISAEKADELINAARESLRQMD